jgi:hypothetical protein
MGRQAKNNRNSVCIHVEGSLKSPSIESSETKTFLEKLLVNLKLASASKVLSCNKRLDDLCNSALLVYIDQGFQAHGWWKRYETGKDIWTYGSIEFTSRLIKHECIRRSWVDHGR